MSTQAGLRDSGRHNTADIRGMAIKKGAAPSPYRTAPKGANVNAGAAAAAVTATFVSPPRNTPVVPPAALSHPSQIPTKVPYTSGAVPNAVSRPAENEGAVPRSGYHALLSRTDNALASGGYSSDLGSSMPSMASAASDIAVSNPSILCERGSGLRSVSDVPVLSMGAEEESCAPVSMEPLMNLAYVRGRVSPVPASAVFLSPATSEEEIVAAFVANCVGRVAETACTPQGKALLVAALETERAEVLAPVVAEMCDRLRDVAVDPHGCHVLRTLVEACTAEQTEELIAALYPSVILNICTTSQHTRLTLQALFERRLVDLWPVVEVLAANAGYLAATQQGCISLMRVFERCDVEQKAALVHELLPKFSALSMDAFANYMVQCAIEHSDRTTAAQYVVQLFAGHLLQMSCDKFASNVVEKVVRVCGGVPAVRRLLLDELIFNPAALKELVADGYGNFVVQSVVEATTNAMELKRVEDRLRPALVGSPFAAKIEAKLKAKRPGQGHGAAGNGQQQQQQHHQQQRRSSYVNHHGGMNVYGQQAAATAQLHGAAHAAVGQRSSAYRVEGPTFISGAPNATIAPATATAHSFRHRPYESQAVVAGGVTVRVNTLEAPQRFQDANAHLRNAPAMPPSAKTQSVTPAAESHVYAVASAGGSDVEDSGPVYGPSPAARRHLQQHQQQFRQPFSGAL